MYTYLSGELSEELLIQRDLLQGLVLLDAVDQVRLLIVKGRQHQVHAHTLQDLGHTTVIELVTRYKMLAQVVGQILCSEQEAEVPEKKYS